MTVLTITFVTEAPNTLIRSSRWNTDFNDITSFINSKLLDSTDNLRDGGIINASISATANISNSKLNLASISQDVTLAGTNILSGATTISGVTTLSGITSMSSKIFKFAKGADVASANTMTLGDDGNFFFITGTTQINTITAKTAGTMVALKFGGALTLSNSGNLKLQNNTNITIAANDTILFFSDGTNWWQVGENISSLASTSRFQLFTTSGSGSFVAPAGVTKVYLTMQGGGGGGGGSATNGAGGGGGAGGAFIINYPYTVTPGNTYSLIVGAGGGKDVSGTATSFDSAAVSVPGGERGQEQQAGPTGGHGGTGGGGLNASASITTVSRTGNDLLGMQGGNGAKGVDGANQDGGAGGNTPFGIGGDGGVGNTSAGTSAAANTGAGGGGSAGAGGGGGTNAGSGGSGFILVAY